MISSFVEAIHYTTLFRTCWLSGRYGGGKTSLAVRLALALVADGYAARIVSNVPLHIGIEPAVTDSAGAVEVRDAVLLIDEAWSELGMGADSRKLRQWLAYLRKHNQFVLMPSVLAISRHAAAFSIEREWSLSPAGIPLWIYRWRLVVASASGRKRPETGLFFWWRPQEVFSLYDHTYKPDDRYFVYDCG